MLHATFSTTRWCLPTPSDSCQSEEGVKSCFPPSDVSIKTTCSTSRTEYHDHLQHCMAQPFIAQVPRLSTNQWWKMMKMKRNWEIWSMMKHCRSGLENHVPPVPSAPSAPAAPLLILSGVIRHYADQQWWWWGQRDSWHELDMMGIVVWRFSSWSWGAAGQEQEEW